MILVTIKLACDIVAHLCFGTIFSIVQKTLTLGAFKLKTDTDSAEIRAGSLFQKSKQNTETTVPVVGMY